MIDPTTMSPEDALVILSGQLMLAIIGLVVGYLIGRADR